MKNRCLPYALALFIAQNCIPSSQAQPHRSQKNTLAWVLNQHLRAMSAGVPVKLGNTEHSVYALSAGGLDGLLVEYTAPPKFRIDMTLGPLHITKADNGLEGWEQDSTGNVRIVRGPELTEERAETNFSLETYDPLRGKAKVILHPERDPATQDYIIDATPPGGTMQTVYINPRTFLYDKMVLHEAGITGTIAIHGYRSCDGVLTPSHLDIGYAGLPVVVTADLKTADYGHPFDKALFRTPASARDFEFLPPAGTATPSTTADSGPSTTPALDSATIPFTSEDDEIVIPVTINGHNFRFLLDSGAGSSFITGQAAKLAALSNEGSMAAIGYGGTTQTGLATHTTVDVGGALRLKGQLLYVIQDPRVGQTLARRAAVDGGLGYDVFARMTVTIDYPNRTIILRVPDDKNTTPAGRAKGNRPVVVPIKLENRTPTIAAAVDGHKVARFLVDTGDNGDIHLYTRYAIANHLMNSAASPDAIERVGVGVGGKVQEITTPGHRIDIGGLPIKHVTLATMHAAGLGDISDYAGGIGNGVLSRYAVTFDYADSTLTLAKSEAPSLEQKAAAGSISAPVQTVPAVGAPGIPPPPPPPSLPTPKPAQAAQPAQTEPVGAPAGITLSELLAKHLAALGGQEALDNITDTLITAQLTTGGITGTVITAFQTPDKEYEKDKLGIMEVSQGYNGAVGWQSDGNGNERPLSADEMKDMRNQIYFDTNSYVLPGRMPGKISLRPNRDAKTGDYVVDVEPEGGKPSTLFFNATSFLIDEERHTDDDVLTTTSFADYKPFDGVMFPTKQHISNGTPRYDMDLTVSTLRNNVPLTPGLFDPPAVKKDYEFVKPGATSATVPFDIDGGEIGFVVMIDGHRERLLFDSGASSIAISKQTADALKLKQAGILEARGYGGSTDLHPVEISSFEIPGAIRMHNVTGVSVNLAPAIESFLNEKVAGFVGYDLLSRFVVRLDYADKTLTFIDPSAFQPTPEEGAGLDVQLDDDIPSVKAHVDSLPDALYLLDTGDFTTLRMYEPYITTSGLKNKYRNGTREEGGGIAGLSASLQTNVDQFSIAGVTFTHVPTAFSLDPKGGVSDVDAGSIGAGILSRFIVTFDFPHGKVYFDPAKDATRPFDQDKETTPTKHPK